MRQLQTKFWSLVSVALICSAVGCAMFQRGPSDEELLTDLVNGWKAAMEEGDIDKVMSFYSENYMGSDGTDYATLEARLEQILPALEQYGIEYVLDDVEIDVEGSTATVGPVGLSSSFGDADLTLETEKESGVWLIVGSEMER